MPTLTALSAVTARRSTLTHAALALSQHAHTYTHTQSQAIRVFEQRQLLNAFFKSFLGELGDRSGRGQAAVRVLPSHGLLFFLWQLLLLVAPLTCIVAVYTQIERGQSADSGQTATVAGD